MKKIFYLLIYILTISCTTNSKQFDKLLDSKTVENITTLNFKVKEPDYISTELKDEALANWNSKGFFNKYKYWFLFLGLYFIIGYKLGSKITDDIYDRRKIKTAYIYYMFSSFIGGHIIYLGKPWKYLLYTVLLITFLFLNTFVIINFYDNLTLLVYTINESLTSKIILSLIISILIFDFFTLSIQVFNVNKSFRDNISPKVSMERKLSFLEIKKTLEKNNKLMLQEFNQWKN